MSQSISYLALGDSYTIGESVKEAERWPVQLAEKLSENKAQVENPRIIATTGWTTDELQKGITQAGISEQYDMVSLLIGVNNQYRGYKFSQYEEEFEELVQSAIGFCKKGKEGVFIVSIPDYGVTPFGQKKDPSKIAEELDQYNAFAESIAKKYNIDFYNITDISRKAVQEPDLVADDALHPSGKMYTQWVDLIYPGVLSMVNK